ncbi:MAG TPA: hypothetical protein VLC55_06945, partial [Burkholderiales bacterium]|nr:hypothetical protein [Burkholderiales bacterium]
LQRRLNLIYDGNPPHQYEDDKSDAPPASPPPAPPPADAPAAPRPSQSHSYEPREPRFAPASQRASAEVLRLWLPDPAK